MRIFLTGITGFIGSHLGRRLVRDGARVYALMRRDSDAWRIADMKKDYAPVVGDLRDVDGMRRALREIRPEIICHLGGLVDPGRSVDLLEDMLEINVKGLANLLRALKNVEYRCFVNTGDAEEYGPSDVPFREKNKPAPVSPYGASKVSSTSLCSMLHDGMGLPLLTLRPFMVYGPGQVNDAFVPSALRKALGGEVIKMTKGEQTRDLVFVDDVVEGYIRAIQAPEAIGEIINLGSGKEHAQKDVVRMIVTMARSASRVSLGALPYRAGDAMRACADTAKSTALLGWTPSIGLEDGLRRTLIWFLEYRERQARIAPPGGTRGG